MYMYNVISYVRMSSREPYPPISILCRMYSLSSSGISSKLEMVGREIARRSSQQPSCNQGWAATWSREDRFGASTTSIVEIRLWVCEDTAIMRRGERYAKNGITVEPLYEDTSLSHHINSRIHSHQFLQLLYSGHDT